MIAIFDGFELTMTKDAVYAMTQAGRCDEAVEHWAKRIHRPRAATKAKIRSILREFGAWTPGQLDNDPENWLRLVWIAAGDIIEDIRTQE